MARDVEELEREVARLRDEAERYRTAVEDALQQVDWCIGYFTGCNKSSIAKSLSANRQHIRKHLMRRAELSLPTEPGGSR